MEKSKVIIINWEFCRKSKPYEHNVNENKIVFCAYYKGNNNDIESLKKIISKYNNNHRLVLLHNNSENINGIKCEDIINSTDDYKCYDFTGSNSNPLYYNDEIETGYIHVNYREKKIEELIEDESIKQSLNKQESFDGIWDYYFIEKPKISALRKIQREIVLQDSLSTGLIEELSQNEDLKPCFCYDLKHEIITIINERPGSEAKERIKNKIDHRILKLLEANSNE